ncbi:chromosome segregation protein SMC [Methylobacterium sp. Leaf456]|uniref:AAA family ATPase n=1 Tax=Methylobacterium sp. Leaf456 TaxID=1736382 RepID=UPI0006FFDB8B|nr:AAA family ATPase [Methylobacterium sp. Leaf456]KQT49283.1 chromosome segregation protein SMC [Methylobacterium sp. Leaf456]
MRILAIRGENLASLAARFEIDLAAGPVSATGLFAITGETGAGKSTILDALCLALYGRYPRVAVSRREDVPDPSGEALSAGDGRAILRRGAGAGFAEVDFVGQDGVGYRVGWEVFRARNRVDGRLQGERRRLHRLDDGSAVASGKTGVLAAVERLTDLTFDQFRRTVLLAQGEFDAFLLAAEGERAELLEKITGTEIYSEISKRVHAGFETHRRAVETFEARRAEIGLLDAQARTARTDEAAAIRAEAGPRHVRQAALRHSLETTRRLDAARQSLAAAEAQVAATGAALANAESDRLRLAELDAVEPLRGRAEAIDASFRDLAAAEAQALASAERVAAAQAETQAAEAERTEAAAADETMEVLFKSFGPLWDQAAELDAAIVHADREAQAAAAHSEAATKAIEAARTTLAGLDRRLAVLAEASATDARRLEAEASHALLAERGEDIARRIRERGRLRREAVSAAESEKKHRAEIARCDAAAEAGTGRLAEIRARRAALAVRRAEREAALAALDEPAALARAGHLEALLDALREAYALAGRHAAALADAAAARQDGAGAEADHAAATARWIAAEAGLREAQGRRAELLPLAELAEESVSREAARLRSLLVPGEPCPVCGGCEHPHAHASNDALGRLADELRTRRTALDAEIAAENTARDRARSETAAAEGRRGEAERRADGAESASRETLDLYRDLLPRLLEALAAAGLAAALPQEPQAESLAAAGLAARAERERIVETLDAARALRSEIDGLVRARDKAEGQAASESRAHELLGRQRQEAALAAGRAEADGAALAERIAALTADLGPALSAGDLGEADLDRDAEAAARRIEALGQAYATLSARHAAREAERAALAPERAAAVTALTDRDEAARRAKVEAANRAEKLAQERETRKTLLGGEATGPHRTRINAERRAAHDALKRVQERAAEAARGLAVRLSEAGGTAAEQERALARRAAAEAAFTQGCGARDRAAVAGLLAVPPPEREALRATLEGLIRAAADAATARATRRADLDGLADAAEIDAAVVQSEAATLAETEAQAQQRLGALDAELARDDDARARAEGLEAEAAAAKAEFAIWAQVEEAIGSAGGDRFRRFAQGITLDHLVHLANEQLRALSPRYRLARSPAADLGLHVIDRDMGEERRATRSLSGGERFLVSLALALALSGLEGRQSFVDTLFIDEGFGSLDAETLDLAVDALETLQGRGRKVGVITHVAGMMERIAVQIRVEKRGSGRSVVRVVDRGAAVP